jgi:hypothetical protein
LRQLRAAAADAEIIVVGAIPRRHHPQAARRAGPARPGCSRPASSLPAALLPRRGAGRRGGDGLAAAGRNSLIRTDPRWLPSRHVSRRRPA